MEPKRIILFIKDIFKNYLDIILFAVNIIILEIMIRHFLVLGLGKLSLLFDFCFIFALSAIFILFKKKIRLILEDLVLLLLGIYGFAQIMHFAYFSTLFSFKKLTVVSELIGVASEVFEKLDPLYLLVFIPLIIQILYSFIKIKEVPIGKIKYALALTSLAIALLAIIPIQSHLKADEAVNGWLGDRYLLNSFHNNIRFYDRFGIFEYIVKDSANTVSSLTKPPIDDEDAKAIKDHIASQSDNVSSKHGIYSGKNLVLVLCESLNYYAIDEELTPTLYMMANDGYYFSNNYAPIYQSATGDSEFISLTGMMPSVDYGTTSYTFYDNDYPFALANLFRETGYNANSYHSYITNFYNRQLFHTSLGFETFYDESLLGLYRDEYYTDAFNWHDDSMLFERTLANTELTDGPFFDFVITASGHMPYVEGRSEIAKNLDAIDDSSLNDIPAEAKYYLAAQMNLDKGLKTLIDGLEKEGVLNDTIIIIYGDHYPYGLKTDAGIDEVIGSDDYTKYQTPLIIYDPTTKGETIDDLSSTFDIYPTICDLFGLDIKEAFRVGRTLFGEGESVVPFMDHSVLTSDFFFDSNTNKTDILSDSYTKEKEDAILNEVRELFDIGQKILVGDYYAHED